MEFPNEIEIQEKFPQLLFKVTLVRHEEPYYRDIGHDLTPKGVKGTEATGRRFKEEEIFSDDDQIFLIHSPKPRAKGTLDFIAENAGLKNRPKREIDQLRSSDYPNHEAFLKHFEKIGGTMEALAEAHFKDEMFETRPDVLEPQSHKKKRLYRAFEYLIRWCNKHQVNDKKPHILGVSHFELITNLIHDVFNIESFEKYNVPDYGEVVNIEAYDSGDKDKILLKVTYHDRMENVFFNRKNRSIEVM